MVKQYIVFKEIVKLSCISYHYFNLVLTTVYEEEEEEEADVGCINTIIFKSVNFVSQLKTTKTIFGVLHILQHIAY